MATTPNTPDLHDRRLGGSRWFRLLTALFAIALTASACSADDVVSETAADAAGDVVEDVVDGDDSEESFAVAEEEAMEDDEEAMEDSGDNGLSLIHI